MLRMICAFILLLLWLFMLYLSYSMLYEYVKYKFDMINIDQLVVDRYK